MEKIGLNTRLLIAQLFNFLLFLWIFKRYMAEPFVKFLKEEKKKEREIERMYKKAEELKTKEEEILKKAQVKAQKEADKILKEAKDEAKRLREKLMAEVKKEVEAERKRLMKELKAEKEEFHRKFKDEIYKVSFLLTEKALGGFFDEKKKKEYTKYLLESLKEIKA